MRVSRHAWHYWLATQGGRLAPPPDLCRYFWYAIGNALLIVGGVLFAIVLAAVATIMLAGIVTFGIALVLRPDWFAIDAGLIAFLIQAGIGGVLIAAMCGATYLLVNTPALFRYIGRALDNPEPLIGSYLAARKARVCPRMEYGDETTK